MRLALLFAILTECAGPTLALAQDADLVRYVLVLRAPADTVVVLPRVRTACADTTLVPAGQRQACVASIKAAARVIQMFAGAALLDRCPQWAPEVVACQPQAATRLPRDTSRQSGSSAQSLVPANLDFVGASGAWALGAHGQGVQVLIGDTGFGPNDFVQIAGGRNFPGPDTLHLADDIPGCNAHGTHVAGIAGSRRFGVAPEAAVHIGKVFTDAGACVSFTFNQMQALDYARAHGIRLVNFSIGGSSGFPFMAQAIADYAAWGGIVIVSSGNNGGALTYPAGYPRSTAIGSVTFGGQRSSWSNFGPGLFAVTGGESIESEAPSNGTAGKSGTSMAAPHALGVAALVLTVAPHAAREFVLDLLCRTATEVGPVGRDDDTGCGVLNAERALQWLLDHGQPHFTAPPPSITAAGHACAPVQGTGPFDVIASVDWVTVTWDVPSRQACVALHGAPVGASFYLTVRSL